jgi:ADP-ribose pyrophosphatase
MEAHASSVGRQILWIVARPTWISDDCDGVVSGRQSEQTAAQQPIPDNAKKVFGGVLFDVYQWEQELFDGTKTLFEKLKRPDTVVVFPVLDDGKIILTEQEQPGKEPFIGATGGRVDEGEDILEAAKRELLEESGYEASEFILWDAQHPTSKIDWVVYTFIAKGLKKVSDMNLDAGEKITLKLVNLDEFIEIAINKNFVEKEIIPKLYEAKLHPEKKEELKKLFNPKF